MTPTTEDLGQICKRPRKRRRRVLTLRIRSVTDRGVDLLIVQLKASIRRLLDNKGVRGRVLDKVNRYGEVVIGVILERPSPGVGSGVGEKPIDATAAPPEPRRDAASQLDRDLDPE